MTRTLKVYSGEDQSPVTDITDMIEWPEAEFGQRAHLGESTLSTIRFRDEDGRVGNSAGLPAGLTPISLNAHNVVIWTESGQTMGRFRISPKDWTRGAQVAGRAREASVTLEDYNSDLRNIVVHGYSRPAETDVARVQGVLATYLSGNPRRTTNLNGSNYVSGSNTVSLPATTYNRTNTAEVLASIAAASNKQYFVTIDASLFYDGNDSTVYACPFKISDRDTDLSSTVFAPQPGGFGPASSDDGQQLLSGIWLFYGESQYVHVTNPTVANQYSWWEDTVYDDTVTTAAQATVVANAMLAQRQNEDRQIAVRIGPLEVGQAIQIKSGQLIQIKWRAIPFADDAYVTRRITELRWTTPEPFSFFADMILDRPIKLHGQGQKIDTVIPRPAPAPISSAAGSAVYTWSFASNNLDDATSTYSAGLKWYSTHYGPADSAFGSGYGHNNHGSLYATAKVPISPSTNYVFSMDVLWQTASVASDVDVKWYTSGGGLISTVRWLTQSDFAVDTEYNPSITLTSPASAGKVSIFFSTGGGLHADNIKISNEGTPAESDPYALTTSGSSPYYARSDDPRFTAADQNATTRLSRTMTNNSGATLATGDVVVPDTTAANSVTRTTTASFTAGRVGIVLAGGTAGVDVSVIWEGVGEYGPNVGGASATAGYYLYTSTTAAQATMSATRTTGAFGRVVGVDGTVPSLVDLWGVPDGSAGASLTVKETDGSPSVSSVDTIAFTGATVTDDTGGDVTVTVSTTTIGAATSGHTHTAGDSARGVATGALTVTGTAQDVTGASLSLAAGTYIVTGIFDVTDNTSDRAFQGILDVNGTDEADFALLTPAGITGDRVTITQTWRITLASTQTVKLQAMYAGGTTGDFTVNTANTAIVAWTAGGTNTSANITGAYDIEGNGSPSYTDAGMSDEFASGTLDAQWTAVGASAGSIALLTANPAASVYDLTTRSGSLGVQIDISGSVAFRIDAIIADGASFVASMWVPSPFDEINVGNSMWVGIGMNDSDTDYDAGNSNQVFWDGADAGRVLSQTSGAAAIIGEWNTAHASGQRMYFRLSRSGTTIYFFASHDGIGWVTLGSEAVGTYNNTWVFFDSKGVAYDGAPIGWVNWVRHVASIAHDLW